MKTLLAVAVTTVLAASSALVHADDAQKAKETGAKPAASPGWIVIEESVWTPLRFEPLVSMDSIRYHYRRHEEEAAANQIDKAVSWLKLAESHALPITKEKLTAAVSELESVSKDLRAGNTIAAAKLDGGLAKAASALGEWHYYKAKESWGRNEAKDAAKDLEMAANYLQHAANSAHYQFGPDTVEVITKLFDHGKLKGEKVEFTHNDLGMHLQSIEKAINDLATALKK